MSYDKNTHQFESFTILWASQYGFIDLMTRLIVWAIVLNLSNVIHMKIYINHTSGAFFGIFKFYI
jgi:hypothetical protein